MEKGLDSVMAMYQDLQKQDRKAEDEIKALYAVVVSKIERRWSACQTRSTMP
jgi:hypothetical protein